LAGDLWHYRVQPHAGESGFLQSS